MPPEAGTHGSPGDWLHYARADLAIARVPLPEGALWQLLCFHAQQVAEKSIKAVLVHSGVDFPTTHAIERLIDLLPANIVRTAELSEAAILTVYATITRYPGDLAEVTEADYQQAVRLAEVAVSWAEDIITRGCKQ